MRTYPICKQNSQDQWRCGEGRADKETYLLAIGAERWQRADNHPLLFSRPRIRYHHPPTSASISNVLESQEGKVPRACWWMHNETRVCWPKTTPTCIWPTNRAPWTKPQRLYAASLWIVMNPKQFKTSWFQRALAPLGRFCVAETA